MAAFVVLLGVQVLSGAVLFARKLGLSVETVQAFYLGSELAFTRPRTLPGLLEVAVPHLLAVPSVLFVLLHLVGFVGLLRERLFSVLARATFAVAAVNIAAGFGVRYLSDSLAWLKLGSFTIVEVLLVLWLLLVLALFRGAPFACSRFKRCS